LLCSLENKLAEKKKSIDDAKSRLKTLEQEKHAIEMTLSIRRHQGVVKHIARERPSPRTQHAAADDARPEVQKFDDIAVLFVDIVGFTEICQRLETNQSMGQVETLFANV